MLNIILSVAAVLCYGVMCFVTLEAFRRLRNVEKSNRRIEGILFGEHIRNCVSQLNDMKRDLNEAIEEENFDYAAKLKEQVKEYADYVSTSLAVFSVEYGDKFSFKVFSKGLDKEEE